MVLLWKYPSEDLSIYVDCIVWDGVRHTFVVEFGSTKDGDYYVDNDTAHCEFEDLYYR
ncbi:MAG: hypothetical protein M1813_002055, partial [Trichoglossum hirsutum]